MVKINEKVYQIEKTAVSNVYLIAEGQENTLIDTGMMGDLAKIKKQIRKLSLQIEDISNIIITHRHMDHIFNLKRLAETTNAKVYVHEDDYEEIEEKVSAENTVQLKEGDILPILGGLEVIHVKGHSPGNMALYSKEYKLLIAGDCIFNNKRVSLPPLQYNYDTEAFLKNVKKLRNYDVEIICQGHGEYIKENCNEIIKELTE